MGVELCMWQITPENLEKLLSSEEAIEAFMEPQFPDPDSPGAVAETLTKDDGIELGKTRHFVHYLITGRKSLNILLESCPKHTSRKAGACKGG